MAKITEYLASLSLSTKPAFTELNKFNKSVMKVGKTKISDKEVNDFSKSTEKANSKVKKLNTSIKKTSSNSGSIKSIRVSATGMSEISRKIAGLKNKFKSGFEINTSKMTAQISALKSKLSGAFIKAGKVARRSLGGISNLISSIKNSAKSIAFTGLAAGAAGLYGANKLVSNASDLAEAQNAVNQAFTEGGKALIEYSKNAPKELGQSEESFLSSAVPIGAQLSGAGAEGQKLVDETIKLAKAATDFGSIFNVSTKDFSEKISAGLRGETEGLRAYGIDVSDAAIGQEALAQGISKTTTKMVPQEKFWLRLAIIKKKHIKYDGDFKNTSNQVANASKILSAKFNTIGTTIGKRLLPIKEKLVLALIKVADKFADFISKFDSSEIGKKFNLWVAQIDFDKILKKVTDFIKDFDFTAAFDRFKIFIDEVKLYADKFLGIFDKVEKASGKIKSIFGKNDSLSKDQFNSKFQPKAMSSLNTSLKDGGGQRKSDAESKIVKVDYQFKTTGFEDFKKSIASIRDKIKLPELNTDLFMVPLSKLSKKTEEFKQFIDTSIVGGIVFFSNKISSFFDLINTGIEKLMTPLRKLGELMLKITNFKLPSFKGVKESLSGIGDKIKLPSLNSFKESLSGIGDKFKLPSFSFDKEPAAINGDKAYKKAYSSEAQNNYQSSNTVNNYVTNNNDIKSSLPERVAREISRSTAGDLAYSIAP